jgi:hypothetical protein
MQAVGIVRPGPTSRRTFRRALVTAAALSVAYFALLRPLGLRWGATDAEMTRPMPGDLVVGNATFVATRAVTIDAPPEVAWRWVSQAGARDGFLIKGFAPNHYMLWLSRSAPRVTWCWGLYPTGRRQTRLVTRVRFRHAWLPPAVFRAVLTDLGNVITVRRAMLDVKARAEATPRK